MELIVVLVVVVVVVFIHVNVVEKIRDKKSVRDHTRAIYNTIAICGQPRANL